MCTCTASGNITVKGVTISSYTRTMDNGVDGCFDVDVLQRLFRGSVEELQGRGASVTDPDALSLRHHLVDHDSITIAHLYHILGRHMHISNYSAVQYSTVYDHSGILCTCSYCPCIIALTIYSLTR